jgi:hypothetical protein
MSAKKNPVSKLVLQAMEKPLRGGVWKPEKEGDFIEGDLVTMGESQGKYGPQTTLTIQQDGLGYAMIYANESLKREITESKAQEGDKIAIVFRGAMKTAKGRPFKLFSVAVAKK